MTQEIDARNGKLADLQRRHGFGEPIYVTRPSMPSLDAYREKLESVWESRWLTNDGALQQQLCEALREYLGVPHVSLCSSGTMALLIALQAYEIHGGEVITTPFTFPATVHAIHWNRATPVFCDIEEGSFGLDPTRLESLIGPETRAILPVHLFGHPCDMEGIQAVADRHGIHVIYDAAHMMGVRKNGDSVLLVGDLSVLSFHATKPFTTIEGGAVVSHSEEQRARIDSLKNFGIKDEETVIGPGINGKLNEFQAAFGLLQLEDLESEISRREALTRLYRDRLEATPGITVQEDAPGVRHNRSHLVVQVDPDLYGLDRDQLCTLLRGFDVHARRYFHPLCSRIPCYAGLSSATPELLPVAERVASRVLCLPLYGSLEEESVETICAIIAALPAAARRAPISR